MNADAENSMWYNKSPIMYVDSENESSDMSDDDPICPPGWWETYYSFGE